MINQLVVDSFIIYIYYHHHHHYHIDYEFYYGYNIYFLNTAADRYLQYRCTLCLSFRY